MPFYRDLRNRALFTEDERDWVSRRLLDLRAQLSTAPPLGVPNRTLRSSLIIGTWNLRDFDNNKYRHGPRRRESLFYIAEVISSFDVCAVQEINEDLGPLKAVMRILGPHWNYIATDVTVGASGNRERMAFVFDTRKVTFRNVAGEIVLPKHALLPDEKQFARTPFMVSFQAGWFKFSLCTVHIYFGSHSRGSDGYKRRVAEIESIAKEMAKRADREDENYILLGDFNIKNTVDETMRALTKAGFMLPPELFPSNLLGTKYYDQIAFRTRRDCVSFLNAGVFNFNKSVFKPEHYEHYAPVLPERHRDLKRNGEPVDKSKDKEYFARRWLTWQMSDHLPLWVELAIDFSDEHLLHNLSDAAMKRGEFAQNENEEQLYSWELPEPPRHKPKTGGAHSGKDEKAEEETKRKTSRSSKRKPRKRKQPRVRQKEKAGVARPPHRMTIAEAWKLFWYVASGEADKVRTLRKENAKKSKPKRRKR